MNVNELGRRALPKAETIKIISVGFCHCLFAQDINDACLSHLFRFRPSAAKKLDCNVSLTPTRLCTIARPVGKALLSLTELELQLVVF